MNTHFISHLPPFLAAAPLRTLALVPLRPALDAGGPVAHPAPLGQAGERPHAAGLDAGGLPHLGEADAAPVQLEVLQAALENVQIVIAFSLT